MNDPTTPPEPVPRAARWRRRATKVGFALLGVLVLYLAFEVGRYTAGYSIFAARRERDVLRTEVKVLKRDNHLLQSRAEQLQTVNVGHSHEEQVVTHTIAHLQARIARQREKIAFYRGVVAHGAPAIGLRVGEVLLSAGKHPRHVHVDISLLRADRPDGVVSGTVSLSVGGRAGTTLDDRSLSTAHAPLKYRFRYYQELKDVLVLPPGFKPAHLTVTVRSHRHDIAPLTQTYSWSDVSVP